jgi:hypothetical protein
MSENISYKPESSIDSPLQKYRAGIDRSLESILAKRPMIPEKQRQLETLGDYGYRMKIREVRDIQELSPFDPEFENYNRSRETEFFIDFDDTIFDYTGYDNAVRHKFEQYGISSEIISKLYEEAKVADPKTGKKMFQRELFVSNLKLQFPDMADEIGNAYADVQLKEFLNKDVAKLLHFLTSPSDARVHILTYGEINFQREKVEAVLSELGKPMDVLYAQVPKAEFLERYLKTEYPYMQTGTDNVQSFVMIDDNPEELKNLVRFGKKQAFFMPLRLRKPNAKRHHIEQSGEKSYEISSQYAWLLLEASAALREARSTKISASQWQEKNLIGEIQANIDKSIESPDQSYFDVKQTDQGTFLLTRKIRFNPSNKQSLEIKLEIWIDDDSGIAYEITRDADGEIRDKHQFAWHSDLFRGDQSEKLFLK